MNGIMKYESNLIAEWLRDDYRAYEPFIAMMRSEDQKLMRSVKRWLAMHADKPELTERDNQRGKLLSSQLMDIEVHHETAGPGEYCEQEVARKVMLAAARSLGELASDGTIRGPADLGLFARALWTISLSLTTIPDAGETDSFGLGVNGDYDNTEELMKPFMDRLLKQLGQQFETVEAVESCDR
jgi:hypothetical protein